MRGGTCTALLVVTVCSALLTGCASTTTGTARPAEQASGEQPSGGQASRDPAAVDAALRGIDPCALLDTELAESRGIDMTKAALTPQGPHTCLFTPGGKYSPELNPLEVNIGVFFDHVRRYSALPVMLGGVRTFETRDYSRERHTCELAIPVSPTRAIAFDYAFRNADTCSAVRAYAKAAIKKLRSARQPPAGDQGNRPFTQWDGCTFLSTLLAAQAERYSMRPTGVNDPYSGCETASKEASSAATPRLVASYSKPPDDPEDPRTISGKTVSLEQDSYGCTATWKQADTGVDNEWMSSLVFELSMPSCDRTAELTKKAIALASKKPTGTAAATPQQPLLYPDGKRVSPYTKGCVHFASSHKSAKCAPYTPVQVPKGLEAIMASQDKNVQCALYNDAVREHYDAEFMAVTWGSHCFFVEKTHRLQITADIIAGWKPADYGDSPALYTGRRVTEFAGKQAVAFFDKDKTSYDIYLSPYDDINRGGALHLHVEVFAERGRLGAAAKAAPDKLKVADKIMTSTVRRYLE